MKKFSVITLFFLLFSLNSFADNSHFIDFTKVLNSSKAGAGAQKKLQEKFVSESKKFKKLEEDIRNEETDIISQKKTISAEEYQKKVANLQKSKQTSFKNISKSRNDAKLTLLKSLNPILKKYMEENKIKIILDKKAVVLGDISLEITDQIIATLNKEVSSIKIN